MAPKTVFLFFQTRTGLALVNSMFVERNFFLFKYPYFKHASVVSIFQQAALEKRSTQKQQQIAADVYTSNPKYSLVVRLHGKTNVGKTALVRALCRQHSLGPTSHSESHGLIISSTVLPIKFSSQAEAEWILLTLEDTGAIVQDHYKYLQVRKQVFDAHLVLFSLVDKDSLAAARTIIASIRQASPQSHIILVGSRVDDAQNFQISTFELEDFAEEFKLPICLVNNLAQSLAEVESAYGVVEELCELVLGERLA